MTIQSFSGEYSFLSNFFRRRLVFNGWECVTAEHAFQAAKCRDAKAAEFVLSSGTPNVAKQRGRAQVLRRGWERIKISVMREVLRAKFQDKELREWLLATGDEELIEGNTWKDTFWGVDTKRGGENHLGRLLMELRSQLRQYAGPSFIPRTPLERYIIGETHLADLDEAAERAVDEWHDMPDDKRDINVAMGLSIEEYGQFAIRTATYSEILGLVRSREERQ